MLVVLAITVLAPRTYAQTRHQGQALGLPQLGDARRAAVACEAHLAGARDGDQGIPADVEHSWDVLLDSEGWRGIKAGIWELQTEA